MSLHPEPSTWPLTVEAAVDRLLATMHPYDQLLLQRTAEKDLIQFHMSWGMSIRHEFGLWRDNNQLLDACGTDEPDSASMAIIKAVWQRLQGEPTIVAEPTVEHVAMERYEMVMASDVKRDGMSLELQDRVSGEVAMEVFYSEGDGTFVTNQFRKDVAPEVVTWFEAEARRRLSPEPDAE